MKLKLLTSVCALVVIALTLLSFRQARIVQVNRMNRAYNALQQEHEQWQRLRMELAKAARPDAARPDADDAWSAAIEHGHMLAP